MAKRLNLSLIICGMRIGEGKKSNKELSSSQQLVFHLSWAAKILLCSLVLWTGWKWRAKSVRIDNLTGKDTIPPGSPAGRTDQSTAFGQRKEAEFLKIKKKKKI